MIKLKILEKNFLTTVDSLQPMCLKG